MTRPLTTNGRRALLPSAGIALCAVLAVGCPLPSPTVVPDNRSQASMTQPNADTDAHRHPSGMTVLYRPNHAAPVAAFQVWVRVGSGDESPAEAGLAHVHEHMIFKGTERRGVGEIARGIESIGGSINAWTSFDQTVYHIVVPSRFASEGLEILLDAVANSTFDEDELERELEVIQEEIRRSEDMPSRAVSRRLFETIYTTHPYGRPVIGSSESVASFERDDVLRFFQRWYRPQNMTLVAVGDVDRDMVDAAVTAEFGRSNAAAPTRHARPVEPPQTELRVTTETRDVQEGHVAIGFPGPALGDADTPALELLSILLGQGESSLLFESVQRRQALTSEVHAYLYSPAEPGIFLVGATFPGETDPARVVAALVDEIARLRHALLSTADIQRALTILESDTIYQAQTVQGVAQRLGYFHTVAGDSAFERRFLELAREVTPTELRDVAERYLSLDAMTIALVVPEAMADHVQASSVEAHARAAYARAATPSAHEGLEADAYGTVRHTFPNGLVAVVQHDPAAPMFSVRAAAMGGLLAEGETDNGVNNLIARMLTAGTSSRSASELALEVDALAASMAGFSGRNTIGMRMTALSRDFESAMELFADALLDATFPADELARTRAEITAEIIARQDNLGGSAFLAFNEVAYAGHPYALSVLGTVESVGDLDRAELTEAYHRLVQPSRMVVSIVGDVEPTRAFAALERLMNDTAPAAPRELTFTPPSPSSVGPTRLHSPRDRQQTHVVLGYPTEPMDGPHRHALDVLGAVLGGQGGRLFVELRDRQSLAYSVGAYASSGYAAGTFAFYIATSPDKVEQSLAGIREEVERLRSEPITEEELERAVRSLIGRRDIGLQRHSARAGYYVFDELYGRGYDHGYGYADRIEAVRAEDVQRAAELYFRSDSEIVSIVGRVPSGGDDDAETTSATP